MKGTAASLKIREIEEVRGRYTPIIALTADAVPSTRTQIKESKIDAYMLKPIDEQQMWTTIEAVLSEELPRHPQVLPRWHKHKTLGSPELPVRDREKALSVTGGDEKLAAEMFSQLKRELPDHLSALKQQLADRDWSALREITHKMHGSSSSCGVPALDYAVQQFNASCREQAFEQAIQLLHKLAQEIERVLKS